MIIRNNEINSNEFSFKTVFTISSIFSFFFILFSCTPEIKGDADRFKKGVFEIPAGNGYGKTTIIRKDSLQIEEYERIVEVSNDSTSGVRKIKRIDTLYIKWKNNFFYTLTMKSPKKELDKDPIYVQITEVKDSSYNFSAKIGFSKFSTDGTIYKVK